MYLSHLKWDLYDFGSECFDLKKNKNRSTCGCCPDQWTCGGSSVTVAQNTLGLNSMSENCFFSNAGHRLNRVEFRLDAARGNVSHLVLSYFLRNTVECLTTTHMYLFGPGNNSLCVSSPFFLHIVDGRTAWWKSDSELSAGFDHGFWFRFRPTLCGVWCNISWSHHCNSISLSRGLSYHTKIQTMLLNKI